MAEKTTVSSLMKEWNDHLTEDVSAFTVVPEGSCDMDTDEAKAPIRVKKSEMVGSASNAYGVRRKSIDTLMTKTSKLLSALDKAQKKSSEGWGHVGTAGAIEYKLRDISQMLNI